MRPFPHYFYTALTSDTAYRINPPGTLSVPRLVSNKPCWQQPSSGIAIKNKKTLFIPHFQIDSWSENQKIIIHERLSGLVHEGFNIYLCKEDGFSSFKSIDFMPTFATLFDSKELYYQIIEELHLTYEEIYIVPEEEFKLFIKGDDHDWLHLTSWSNADLHDSNISGTSLRRFLLEKGHEIERLNLSGCLNLEDLSLEGITLPKLTTLIINQSSRNATNQEKKEQNRCELLEPEQIARISTISIAQINGLLKITRDTLNHLELSDKPLDWSLLSTTTPLTALKLTHYSTLDISWLDSLNSTSLQELDLSHSEVSENALISLFQKITDLKVLHLEECQHFKITMLPSSITSLTSLNIPLCLASSQELSSLLISNPLLEHISLCWEENSEGSENNDEDVVLPILDKQRAIELRQLKSLALHSFNIDSTELKKLLEHAPHLHKLALNEGRIINSLDIPLNLNSLEYCTLTDVEMTEDTLDHLFLYATQLKYLACIKVKEMDLPETGIETPLFPFNLLESLIIDDINFYPLKFFAQTKNLKYFHLGDYPYFISDDEWPYLSWPLLESLSLEYIELYHYNFFLLTQNTPNLKKLNLIGFHCDGSFNEIQLNCLSIESLRLCEHTNTYYNYSNINSLLIQFPQLKKLDLKNNLLRNEDDNLEDYRFFNLEFLDISGTIFCDDIALNHLLSCYPNLRTLILTDLPTIGNNSVFHQLTLNTLSSLTIKQLAMNHPGVSSLLTAAPNLKFLKLFECFDFFAPNSWVGTVALPSLKIIQIGTNILTPEALADFRALYPHIRFIEKDDDDDVDELDAEYEDDNLKQLIAPHRPHKKELSVDANTQMDPNKQFNVRKIFFAKNGVSDPKVNNYRLSTYNKVDINSNSCANTPPFSLKNSTSNLMLEEPLSLPQKNQKKDLAAFSIPSRGFQEYYGHHTLHLTNEWQALPSLSPHELLCEYRLEPDIAVDICYSRRDNFYYIRNQMTSTSSIIPITIHYILSYPSQQYTPNLPSDIEQTINFYKNFKSGALQLDTSNATGQDYLHAMNQQQVGACRHRTVLFKVWMQHNHPDIPVRIINNECHSFIEIQLMGCWHFYNLGGYRAALNTLNPLTNEIISTPRPLESSMNMIKRLPNNTSLCIPPSPTEQQYVTSPMSSHPPQVLHESSGTMINHLPNNNSLCIPASPTAKQYFASLISSHPPQDLHEYLQSILDNNKSNILIKVHHPALILKLRYHLQMHAQQLARPVFYIQSPEELICSAPYIEYHAHNNTGTLKQGPGGHLHNFLTQHASNLTKSLLIINYDAFNAADIIHFNSLLDNVRTADGTPLPDTMQVIGLFNPEKPAAYNGADFYSRFDARLTCSFSPEEVPYSLNLEKNALHPNGDAYVIQLYGGQAWQEILLGHWSLDRHVLRFNEGALSQAINAGATHIHLYNAPWDLPAFETFWQTVQLEKTININDQQLGIPTDFSFSKHYGYFFTERTQWLSVVSNENVTATYVLNPSLIEQFLGEYTCEHGAIYRSLGLIAAHPQSTLTIYVSHELNEGQWSRILDECNLHQVHLQLTLAPNVPLPQSFDMSYSNMPEPQIGTLEPKNSHLIPSLAYICSTDIDATLNLYESKTDIIIDVTEVEPGDLLTKISVQVNQADLTFHFTEQKGILKKAIEQGQTVILKGHFSLEMQQVLMKELYQQQQYNNPSHILLIGSEPHLFPCISSYKHHVTVAEKKSILPTDSQKYCSKSQLERYSVAELKAIINANNSNHDFDVTLPWAGMKTLTIVAPSNSNPQIDFGTAANKALEFNKNRLDSVNNMLEKMPFVFLAGLSGVGKTSFVTEIWAQKHPLLYVGIQHIKKWAYDKSSGIKTLFIDEANISSRQWSEFEGLFNLKPAILVENEYIHLTAEHKVIFAGNPLSYGGERQMPSFLKRHGNSIVFNPMPAEYIYHTILQPALNSSPSAEEIARPILQVAHYLMSCSHEHILITPRELTAMALFTQNYLNYLRNTVIINEFDYQLLYEVLENDVDTPSKPIDINDSDYQSLYADLAEGFNEAPSSSEHFIAQYYAYIIADSLLPERFKLDFMNQFFTIEPQKVHSIKPDDSFIITPANEKALNALHDFLTLRDRRQHTPGTITQQYGGLGGLILEGEPGIGKTELVAKTLIAYGLLNSNNTNTTTSQNKFYIIPISMAFTDKKTTLLKAFHEGAVVVMDEINSAPMMEELLNALLMGRTPDGGRPQKPGFLIIGTQNPVTMAGRAKASTALQHRMRTVIIPPYQPHEMVDILIHKGLSQNTASEMVQEYIYKRQSKNVSDGPELCFRDLLKRAAQELEETQKKKRTIDEVSSYANQLTFIQRPTEKKQKTNSSSSNPRHNGP